MNGGTVMMKDFDEIFTNYDQVIAATDLVIDGVVDQMTDEEIEMLFLIDSDGRGEGQF
jgi:hypothetical protein